LVSRRLENLFWRIWGNGRIRDNIQGSTIAALFTAISDGDVVIRTTPTSSPRASRMLPVLRMSESSGLPPPGNDVSSLNLVSDDKELSADDETVVGASDAPHPPTVEEEKGRRRGSSRPPPILKKTKAESVKQESKTARILTPTWKTARGSSGDDDESSPQPSSTISFALGPPRGRGIDTTSPEKSRVSVYDLKSTAAIGSASSSLLRGTPLESPKGTIASSSKSSKKKPVVAGSLSTKRRPTVMRRKSSQSSGNTNTQSSSSTGSKAASPRPTQPAAFAGPSALITPLPLTSEIRGARPLIYPEPGSSSSSKPILKSPSARLGRPQSRSTSPESSGPYHRSTRDHLPSITDAVAKPVKTGKGNAPIVEKDFRVAFAEKFRPENFPFPALTRRSNSTVALSTTLAGQGMMAMSDYASRIDKGKGKAKEDIPPNRQSNSIIDVDGDNDEDAPGPPQLPRTKSQLTMLLEKDKPNESEKGSKRRNKGKGPS
jgi:hypothetical protein